jgi:hypothetical protein
LLRRRGYSTKRYKTIQTAYYNTPTALQQASYHSYLIDFIRTKDVKTFESLISSGISPNPCNIYGESLVHLLCRRGEAELLSVLVQNGCTFQVSDDYGRTPLHDACWASTPQLGIVEMILQQDVNLFHMMDSRGALPLAYVGKDQESAWIEFLESKKDVFWPIRSHAASGEPEPPPLVLFDAKSRPVPDPTSALTVELAAMVASGRMRPFEARFLVYDQRKVKKDKDDTTAASSLDMSEYSEDNTCSLVEYEDSTTFNEDEMSCILSTLSAMHNAPANKQMIGLSI